MNTLEIYQAVWEDWKPVKELPPPFPQFWAKVMRFSRELSIVALDVWVQDFWDGFTQEGDDDDDIDGLGYPNAIYRNGIPKAVCAMAVAAGFFTSAKEAGTYYRIADRYGKAAEWMMNILIDIFHDAPPEPNEDECRAWLEERSALPVIRPSRTGQLALF